MPSAPVISLSDVCLSFGGKPLFEGVSFTLSRGERAALVGRNGAGKSTLMRVISGEQEPDSGLVWRQPGLVRAAVAQEPDLSAYATAHEFAAENIPDYRAEAELDTFGISGGASPQAMSGGQLRRLALARAFALDPDILMLDEPTNHLDMAMIEALEERLLRFPGLVITVSHDRRFLEIISTTTLWLRQGAILKSPEGYARFDAWAESIEAEEAARLQRLETQLKDEYRWLARGVTARRRRNQGRLARLKAMRSEHAGMRAALSARSDRAKLNADAGTAQSRKLIDAERVSKCFEGVDGPKIIADNLSLRILRGDRVGLIGPNGAGKTSLLRLLLGDLPPDSGTVRHAGTLSVTYIDQSRAQLIPSRSVWETLAPGGGDSIMVQGQQRHVAAYAKDFLFRAEQLHQPVGALSGGERNRLALAIGLARPASLLVLDEPTNDLDMETLDLLEDMLLDFDGTLLLVSHDRAFLDATVTSCLTFVGPGQWLQTAGGWSDAQQQLSAVMTPAGRDAPAKKLRIAAAPAARAATKLSFKDEHRLKEIDRLLPRLAEEILALEAELADPDLYTRDRERFTQASQRLAAARAEVRAAEDEWLAIEERRAALGE